MIKYKYRFKTEQEFINEFGWNWRYLVYLKFTTPMDYLLGTEIPNDKYLVHKDSKGRIDLNDNRKVFFLGGYNTFNSYFISNQMLKEERIGIDYNEKKTLVYD